MYSGKIAVPPGGGGIVYSANRGGDKSNNIKIIKIYPAVLEL
jgi:hypothetical protein